MRLIPEKNLLAIRPAMGGKKKVHARRMSVNCQPITPISIGSRVNTSSDHPVTRATIVPALAPNLSIPAAMGSVTKGPPANGLLQSPDQDASESRLRTHPTSYCLLRDQEGESTGDDEGEG